MRKLLIGGVAAVCLSLGGCNAGGVAAVDNAITTAQGIAGQALSALNTACASASSAAATANTNPLVSGSAQAQNILAYIGGSCSKAGATGSLLVNAINDPNGIQNTANWVMNLVSGLKGVLG
jgi:hypothetical protein